MRKLLLLLLPLLLLGCDSRLGLQNVQTAFPGCEVKYVPGRSYDFVVRSTNGNIYYAKDYGYDEGIACSTNLVFSAQ